MTSTSAVKLKFSKTAKDAGCKDLHMEEGSCQQLPGYGISGKVDGASVSLGNQEYVYGTLDSREQAAADRFMEASTSQAAGSMQVKALSYGSLQCSNLRPAGMCYYTACILQYRP